MSATTLYTLEQASVFRALGKIDETPDHLSVHKGNIEIFAEQIAAGHFPAFHTAADKHMLRITQEVADELKSRFKHIVFIGTGGSSLSGRMLAQFAWPNGIGCPVKLYFIEAPDHSELQNICANLPLEKTAIVATSKSGETLETLLSVGLFIAAYKDAKIPLEGRLLALSTQASSPLACLVRSQGGQLLKLDPTIGGRYSAFSPVGLLPALLAGLDVRKLCEGAEATLENFLQTPHMHACVGHAAGAVFALSHGFRAEVFMPYGQRLALLPEWWAQLWAESLGKDGRGTTPIKAHGPSDQHSQLQLYLDGPNDKFYTFITTTERDPQAQCLPGTVAGLANMPLLKGLSAQSLMAAQATATIQTLEAAKRPVRHIILPRLQPENLGAVMMYLMLSTAVAGIMWRVNPFDQPAVEAVKVRTRTQLEEGAA